MVTLTQLQSVGRFGPPRGWKPGCSLLCRCSQWGPSSLGEWVITTPWLAGPEPALLSVVLLLRSLLPAATTPKPKWPRTSGSCLSVSFLSWTVLTPRYLIMLQRCAFSLSSFTCFEEDTSIRLSWSTVPRAEVFSSFFFLYFCYKSVEDSVLRPMEGVSHCLLTQWLLMKNQLSSFASLKVMFYLLLAL